VPGAKVSAASAATSVIVGDALCINVLKLIDVDKIY
jgi:hypothetical protein